MKFLRSAVWQLLIAAPYVVAIGMFVYGAYLAGSDETRVSGVYLMGLGAFYVLLNRVNSVERKFDRHIANRYRHGDTWASDEKDNP